MVANVLQTVAIGFTFYFLMREIKPVQNRLYFAPAADWPIFLGIAMFSFESIGMVSYYLASWSLTRISVDAAARSEESNLLIVLNEDFAVGE